MCRLNITKWRAENILLNCFSYDRKILDLLDFVLGRIPAGLTHDFPSFYLSDYLKLKAPWIFLGNQLYINSAIIGTYPEFVQLGLLAEALAFAFWTMDGNGNLHDLEHARRIALRWGFSVEIEAIRSKNKTEPAGSD